MVKLPVVNTAVNWIEYPFSILIDRAQSVANVAQALALEIFKTAFEILKTTCFLISWPVVALIESLSPLSKVYYGYYPSQSFKMILFFNSMLSAKIYLFVCSIFQSEPISYNYLNSCIDENRIDILKLLISKNVPLNTSDSPCPPIERAILKNDSELVKFLISQGAKVNWESTVPDFSGSSRFSALKIALEIGASFEMIKLLIK